MIPYYIDEGQYEEGIYLTYERFEDHTLVSYLLKEATDLKGSFSKDGQLYKFIKDRQSCHVHQGVLEALSIQLPEKFSHELYERYNHQTQIFPLLKAMRFNVFSQPLFSKFRNS